MSIADQYHNIQSSIEKKLSSLSKNYSDIELIAVSKKQSQKKIIELLKCGHRSFGENQIQEIESKWPAIKKDFSDVKLSFIGSIGFIIFIKLVKNHGPVFASQVNYLVTISGIMWGYIILSEVHSMRFWVSLFLIIGGLFLVRPIKTNEHTSID